MITITLAVMAMLGPGAFAVEITPIAPLDITLHPFVAGNMTEPGHALMPQIEAHAQRLLELGGQMPLTPAAAAAYLQPLAASEKPEDRLAAGAITRLLVEPGLAASMEGFPRLEALGQALVPADPYRGSLHESKGALGYLAESARQSPAVQSLFDGRRAMGLGAENVVQDGPNLIYAGGKLKPIGKIGQADVYPHPEASGAVIEVHPDPIDATAIRPLIPAVRNAMMARMAAQGLGPRVLGDDLIVRRPVFQPMPMRAAVARERIYGSGLDQLSRTGEISPDDKALVADLLRRAADRDLDLSSLSAAHIAVGHTALDGRRRAYIVDPSSLRAFSAGHAAPPSQVADWLHDLDEITAAWLRKITTPRPMGIKF